MLKEQPYCSVPGCQNLAVDVHHHVALEDGGDPYDRTQLEGLCKMHHSRVTAQEIWGRKAAR